MGGDREGPGELVCHRFPILRSVRPGVTPIKASADGRRGCRSSTSESPSVLPLTSLHLNQAMRFFFLSVILSHYTPFLLFLPPSLFSPVLSSSFPPFPSPAPRPLPLTEAMDVFFFFRFYFVILLPSLLSLFPRPSFPRPSFPLPPILSSLSLSFHLLHPALLPLSQVPLSSVH